MLGTRTGVFAGIASHDYDQVALHGAPEAQAYAATGLSTAMLANRLSYLLDIHGPSETVDTACSSSLVAVHRAVHALRHGECELAIAGGVNLLLSAHTFHALTNAGLLSPNGACKPFDATADGYVRAEGAGAVVLKPLAQAIEDRDHIYAVIRGSALGHGGRTASLTAPSQTQQAQLIQTALNDAGVAPQTITYIEAHGTGTRLGDPIEVNGLKQALAATDGAGHRRPYCGLGSVKSNIGHAEAAAGIAGLIKTALALTYRKIPGMPHFTTLNPHIDLKRSPFYIAARTRPWACLKDRAAQPIARRAGISSFGFGGAYAHLVLEEAPVATGQPRGRAKACLAVLSAKSAAALRRRMEDLERFLENSPRRPVTLADICFTLQLGREHYPLRAAFIARKKTELQQLLREALDAGDSASGALFVASQVQRRAAQPLTALAQAWLQGASVAWPALSLAHAGRRVPLPAYPFEPTPHWVAPGRPSPGPSPAPMAPRPIPPLEEMRRWLLAEIAKTLGRPWDQIDPGAAFDELGLDSLALIDLFDRLKRRFNGPWPIAVIQECSSIAALAARLCGEAPPQRPDLWGELFSATGQLAEAFENKGAAPSRTQEDGLGQTILLTGATGFLGTFLLRQLLRCTPAVIYCLLRAPDMAAGFKRIQDNFHRFMIREELPAERVLILPGDLTQERFGLEPEAYDTLALGVDSVFHCGAVVDWMKPYAALKKPNVGGTVEAIRFSLHRKIKPLHVISSLAVLPLVDGKYHWLETELPPPENLTNGYAQSKWVAERLCAEARQIGLPVSIYRFDYVAGSIQTGAMKPTDFIVRLIKGCIELGCVPREEVNFDIHCVAHLSQAMVAIARLNRPQTYHLLNRQPFLTSDFTRLIRQMGYSVEELGFDRWKQRVRQSPGNALFALHPFLDHYSAGQLAHYFQSKIDQTNTLTALYEVDQRLILDAPTAHAVMARVIAYFQEQRWLPAPKLAAVLRRQSAYWRRQLEGAPDGLELPHPSLPAPPTAGLDSARFIIGADLLAKIRHLAAAEKISVAEVLLSVFQTLLLRYSRNIDILVAVALAADAQGHDQGIPKIPLIRTPFAAPLSLRSLLAAVKQTVSEALAHLDLSSAQIAALLNAPNEPARRLPYGALFAYRAIRDTDTEARLNLFPLSPDDLQSGLAPLCLWIEREDDSLQGRFDFSPQRFSADTISRLCVHFTRLLATMVADPELDIFHAPLLDTQERDQMLCRWNATRNAFPLHLGVHELFHRQAVARPEAIAVEMQGQLLTYGELDWRSDCLARHLRDRGIGAGDLVALGLEKCADLIIGLLGILKADGAYLCLDLAYPSERLKYMLSDAQPKMLLTQSGMLAALPPTDAQLLCLDHFWNMRLAPEAPPAHSAPPSDVDPSRPNQALAYMIYTSGSTGQPKGVRVHHAGLVNLLLAIDEHLQLQPGGRALTIASLNYDASVLEIFYPLAMGATLVLPPQNIATDGARLKQFLETHPIALLIAAVPTWRMLEYAQWQGDPKITLLNGGEALPYALAQTLIGWSKAAYNGYGPAEATVCATIQRLAPGRGVTIGRPLANTQIYILDDDLNPMPIGAAGEIYIGGVGVARGYHRRPELTHERFVPHPFEGASAGSLYRTGDLAYFLPTGEIEFVGRRDHQVKIRGQRVELGEIERVITQNSQVKACTALLREDGSGEKKIVAYIIPAATDAAPRVSEIKQSLKPILPAFMIPAHFVVMEQFPMTPGGKIDRRAFPPPEPATSEDAYIAPASTLEIEIAGLWRSILNIAPIGVHASFLDLGGDSITATRLLIDLNARYRLNLYIQDVYENPTIAQLAALVGQAAARTCAEPPKPRIDFVAETDFQLPINLDRIQPGARLPQGLKHGFLTGATGFLGAFILARLLEESPATLHCLVRAQSLKAGAERIRSNLEKYSLWRNTAAGRIQPVLGDLGQPLLGMDPARFEDLAQQMDAIFHCGSMVHFAYPYPLLKKPNVDGTKEILKLTASRKIKPLFYVSTIGVFEQEGSFQGNSIGEDSPLGDPEQLFFGYSKSKWVSEKIVAAARQTGLPISIFRPSSVLGDRQTGHSNLDDLVNVMIYTFAKVRAFPDLDFQLNGLPVDFVADAIVRIALSPRTQAQGKNYHIVHAQAVPVRRLIDYFIFRGYDYPVLPCSQWLERLADKARSNSDLAAYLPVIQKEIGAMNGRRLPEFSFKNTLQALPGYRRSLPELDSQLFQRYLAYLERIDFIQRAA
jgi:amino acid adenylation domain-containing protein/thioester reductase-like protein